MNDARSSGICLNTVAIRAPQAACAESENWTVLRPSRPDRVSENDRYDNWIKFEDNVENMWGPVHDLRAARHELKEEVA